MSRKIMLSIAAATFVVAAIVSQSADARGFGGGHGFGGGRGFGGGHMGMARMGGHRNGSFRFGRGRGRHPGHPIWAFHHRRHHYGHWAFRGGRWIETDGDSVAVQTPAAAPAPCTCLTKTYTENGLVVFADVCTKESASAPAGSSADATQEPTTAAQN